MSDLPAGWEHFDHSQMLAALYVSIQSNASKTEGNILRLIDQVNVLTGALEKQSERVTALENENHWLRREVNQLKDRRVNANPCSELKVTGVPQSCKMSLNDITETILDELGIPSLPQDVIEVREFKCKSPKPKD
ncbi:hypothetical protein QAD02_003538 [Eretmocerus hayati]|uniref:Uncharacterized protein n=1 Tax=Eretmocerus hayati TaxID=131215 RepID=A0ACC2NM02_9HYME|nr:hypothetical protein QAD02_003538 [Eretmocerus hayati]